MKIKGFILAAVFAFAYASSAMAGTLWNDQPFNGLYVGVLGGYGHEDNTASGIVSTPFTAAFSSELGNEGSTYGAFGGFGTMLGSMFYIGLEGQYNFFNRDASEENIGGINFRRTTDDGWNVGGRLGLVLGGNTLLFARGAFAEINVAFDDQTNTPDDLDLDTLEGYEVGLGAEYALSNHFTVRGEYVYSNYGSVDINYTGVNPHVDVGNYDLTSSEIRLALTLEF